MLRAGTACCQQEKKLVEIALKNRPIKLPLAERQLFVEINKANTTHRIA
jgi:hypothetical protein